MDVFGHDDVAEQTESVAGAFFSQDLYKLVRRMDGSEIQTPLVTTEGDEMEIAATLETSVVGVFALKRKPHPYKPKGAAPASRSR